MHHPPPAEEDIAELRARWWRMATRGLVMPPELDVIVIPGGDPRSVAERRLSRALGLELSF